MCIIVPASRLKPGTNIFSTRRSLVHFFWFSLCSTLKIQRFSCSTSYWSFSNTPSAPFKMLCQVTWVFLGCIVVHTYIFTLSHRHYSFRYARKRYLCFFSEQEEANSTFMLVNEEYIRCSSARQPKLFPFLRACTGTFVTHPRGQESICDLPEMTERFFVRSL